MRKLAFAAMSLLLLAACNSNKMENVNPLLADSPLPYGAPQFDKISLEHYLPAFEQSISDAKAEVDGIIENSESPTFQNTIEALEFVGLRYNDVASIFFNLLEADSNPEMQELADTISSLTTGFSMYVSLNDALFQRVKAVYDQRESLALDQDQKRLLDNTYKSFVRNGANLSADDKKLYSGYIEQLNQLSLDFSKNVLAATNAFKLVIDSESELDGLPEFVREQFAAAAREAGKDEGWLIDLSQPSYSAFMKYSTNRDLKEKLYRAYNTKGLAPENDNTGIIKQIVDLRLKVARLLGFDTYADYAIDDRMAKSTANVQDFLRRLTEPSLPAARREVAELNEYAKANGFEGATLMPWDFSYWAERLRVEKYDLSDEELKPYFKLDDCIPAAFSLANKLYGLTFEERKDIPVYHPDVRVYDVKDADGSHLALFYADFFPRESKRGGAWMTEFRPQRIVNGVEERPFISIVTNFTKPVGDTPALITHDEFITFLHEFGHSLQGITAVGRYPSMTGTSVDHDFVELFSQINENWGYESEYLNTFAKHYQTGEVIPQALIDKIKNAKNYLAAYYHVRQLQFGVVDMAWHTVTSAPGESVLQFERNALEPLDVMPPVDGCCSSTSFNHIFSGGYSAGYYSYKWSEVLAADAFSLFEEKGLFDQTTASSFRKMMSTGDAVDPAELYRQFRGHDPEPEALLIQLGIIGK